MAGMTAEEKEDMSRFVLDVREELSTTIVLVEHDMGVVMDIATRIVVLDFGRKIAEGLPREIANDPAVISAYLGSAEGLPPPPGEPVELGGTETDEQDAGGVEAGPRAAAGVGAHREGSGRR